MSTSVSQYFLVFKMRKWTANTVMGFLAKCAEFWLMEPFQVLKYTDGMLHKQQLLLRIFVTPTDCCYSWNTSLVTPELVQDRSAVEQSLTLLSKTEVLPLWSEILWPQFCPNLSENIIYSSNQQQVPTTNLLKGNFKVHGFDLTVLKLTGWLMCDQYQLMNIYDTELVP